MMTGSQREQNLHRDDVWMGFNWIVMPSAHNDLELIYAVVLKIFWIIKSKYKRCNIEAEGRGGWGGS